MKRGFLDLAQQTLLFLPKLLTDPHANFLVDPLSAIIEVVGAVCGRDLIGRPGGDCGLDFLLFFFGDGVDLCEGC